MEGAEIVSLVGCMTMRGKFASLAAFAALLCAGSVGAQPRSELEVSSDSVLPVTDPAAIAEWLGRLVGQFKYEGMLHLGPGCEGDSCVEIKGNSDCTRIGDGPGVHCILNVTWIDKYPVSLQEGTAKMVQVSYLDPAMELYGIDPGNSAINHLVVNNKGLPEGGLGYIKGNTATFKMRCVNAAAPLESCYRVVRIEARRDSDLLFAWFGFIEHKDSGIIETYATMSLRRMPPGKAAGLDNRLREVTSEESREEIARAEEDAREEREALALDKTVTAPVPSLNSIDEVVAEGERERRRQAQLPRRIAAPDVVTVTRTNSRTGNGSIRVRVQPYSPQREIRLRPSDARKLAEGANQHLKLQRDRLTTDNESMIRSVTLEFNAGADEDNGLPALIPINATTSLFNFDYVRLDNSTQPLMATLRNVMDPQTRRCVSALKLGDGAEDFHNRFALLGDRYGDCTRTVNSREGDLIFADSVPQRLRQELRDFYDPVDNRFALNLGSEPGMVFVIWRPESPRNDFRLVRSLNRTSLLVFNGPSWEHGITPQQRDALWEDVAQEQIERRIRGGDVITEAAANYLLKLARAERQQTIRRWLTTEVPEWIAACGREMSLRASIAGGPRGNSSYDCGLVVQFVYDAVARAKSKGEGTVMRTWRTLLADAYRRKQDGVSSSAFLDSSADARRIVQGLLSGVVDWTAFAVELGKVGVQLRVTSGQLGPSVQVQSLADFRE